MNNEELKRIGKDDGKTTEMADACLHELSKVRKDMFENSMGLLHLEGNDGKA